MNHLPFKPISHEAELTLLARSEASRTVRIDETQSVDPTQIIHLTAHYFGVDPERLKSKTRKREIVLIRQCLLWYIHKELRYTLASTGAFFEKDHATVLHACRCIENVATDSALRPVFVDFNTFIGSIHTAVPEPNYRNTDSNIFHLIMQNFGRGKNIAIYGKDFKDFLDRNSLGSKHVYKVLERLELQRFIVYLNPKQTWFKVI